MFLKSSSHIFSESKLLFLFSSISPVLLNGKKNQIFHTALSSRSRLIYGIRAIIWQELPQMLNFIHTSSHLQTQGSWCTQECEKGRAHHPALPVGAESTTGAKSGESHQCRCCCQGTPNACKISFCTFQFFSFPAMAFMFSSLHPNCSLPSIHLRGKQAAPPSAATPTLLLAAMLGTGGSSPQLCSDEKRRIQQQYLEQANGSLGWQLGYRIFCSRCLVSSGFSAKTKKDKKCREDFSS